ncbi:PRD domain-containing protein [Ornithinibacillus gellani]|uniref:BglG family transcription antiterminator n=1 Tax=Ornithinibacillus gellani TaxID=2293253 RepID=UPI000F4A0C83|nr:PRD domain-containing protein [Ornithinibacillus gellani]TQS74251.1 PRD domain-containing protein [Ornithinibacillus gellani]
MMDLNRRQLIILNELFNQKVITSLNLSLAADTSVRTVKSDIAYLRKKLDRHGIGINSSPNKGYSLNYHDSSSKEYLSEFFSQIDMKRLHLFKRNNYERVFYILRTLLLSNNYIKLDDLANEMFVSRSTLNGDMPEVKRILDNYQLQIESKANYGIIIRGEELNKRVCIAEHFFHNKTTVENSKGIDLEVYDLNRAIIPIIEEQLRIICDQNQIILSDFSLKNIAIHVLISIFRSKSAQFVETPKEYREGIKTDYPNIYSASMKLCHVLNSVFNTGLNDGDAVYICMHLEGKQILQNKETNDNKLAEVNDVLTEVYAEIKNNFDIDISLDPILNEYLALHLLQMIRRIKNRMVLRNPVVHENLQKYLFATKVAISATKVIEDHYDIKINLDEFGYLVLYFNVALRNLRKKERKTICLVSGRGRAETIMYINELEDNFPEESFKLINFDSIDDAIEHIREIDVLVSSYEVKISRPIPQVSIEKGNYINNIWKIINKVDLNDLDVDKYFKPEHMNFELEGDSQQEILQQVVVDLKKQNIIEQDVNVEVPFVSHEIGNNIVHLQDLQKICRKPVCYIAVLKSPIIWEKDIIKVLFLIKTKKDGDHNLNILCDMFSNWTRDRQMVNRLINHKSFQLFMEDIQNY